MKCFYDLHIHSDLSPCADGEMTPNNIVNMSYIKGLNIISVTDHNSMYNYPSIKKIGDMLGIEVIPGMEVTTREDVHVLCYFRNYDEAKIVADKVFQSLPNIKNKPHIFGNQNIYNEEDAVIDSIDKLLINASAYSIDEIYDMVKANKGVSIPAHVNKKSNGILGVLGFIPNNLDFAFVEVYDKIEVNEKLIKKYKRFKNSDAHRLTDIAEAENCIELDSPKGIYEYLGL